jgi:DnaJ-class molecular chaperone
MKTAALVTSVMLMGIPGCGDAPVDRPDIVADLACETARMAVGLGQEMPPAPKSDKCENCDGTGKLGDGRITTTCPVCKGTGKKCPDGKCKP